MKRILKYGAGLSVLALISFLFTACEKTFDSKFNNDNPTSNSAVVQVFMAMVNANRNYVSLNSKDVTGSLMTSGSIFPSTGYGFAVPGGNAVISVRDTSSTTTQVPLTFGENFAFGKNYTVFIYDTINSPKQKTVETNIVIPSDTSCRIRFANFIYNPTVVPAIDVFSFNLNRNIFTNVSVTDVSNYIPYPSRLATDTLYIRETGSTTNIIKFAITGGLTLKRSYTLVYRGSHRGTRTASLFTNY